MRHREPLDDLAKIEAAKICAEINQLQNQRFTLVLAALTFAGVSGGWMFHVTSHNGRYLLSTTVLLGLIALAHWLKRISRQVVRLSVYLEARFACQFEIHHRDFSLGKYNNDSQTKTQYQLLGSFGLMTCAMPFLLWFAAAPAERDSALTPPAFFVMLAAASTLCVVLFLFAQSTDTDYRRAVRASWDHILGGHADAGSAPRLDRSLRESGITPGPAARELSEAPDRSG